MYTKNELMFPHYAVAQLREARGAVWRDLVDRVAVLPESHEEVLGFMLVMIRLNGCMPCETDSYRAMRGCVMCSMQTLRRFKGSDDDLLHMFRQAIEDIHHYQARPDRTTISDLIAEVV